MKKKIVKQKHPKLEEKDKRKNYHMALSISITKNGACVSGK